MKGNRPQPVETGRMVNTEDLISLTGISKRLGWSTSTVANWAVRYPQFPTPAAWLYSGRVWLWSEIIEWARATGRQPFDD